MASSSPKETALAAVLSARERSTKSISADDWQRILNIAWVARDETVDRRDAQSQLKNLLDDIAIAEAE